MSFLKIERLNNMKGNNLVQFDKLILTKLIEESVRQDSLNLYLTYKLNKSDRLLFSSQNLTRGPRFGYWYLN